MTSVIVVYTIAFYGFVKRHSKATMVALLGICIIMAWLSVDSKDYGEYQVAYQTIAAGGEVRFELGYVLLNRICSACKMSYVQFRGVYSAIALFILTISIKKLTQSVTFVLSLGLVYPLMYLFPIQRYFLAAVIVIFAFSFLVEDGVNAVFIYEGLIFLAGLIHSSCFFFLVLPVGKFIKRINLLVIFAVAMSLSGIFLSGSGLLARIISQLPLGELVRSRLLSSQHANLNGLLVFLMNIIWVTLPGYLASYLYFTLPVQKKNIQLNKFMQTFLSCNILALALVVVRVFSPTADRLLYVYAILNYIAVGNTLHLRHRNLRSYDKTSLLLRVTVLFSSVGYVLCQLFYLQPHLLDVVFWMHFRNNPILSCF